MKNVLKKLTIQYVAAVYPITCRTDEEYKTEASSVRELIETLDECYGGFREMFINPETGKLNLNTMINYGDRGAAVTSVLDLDRPIADGGKVTFW